MPSMISRPKRGRRLADARYPSARANSPTFTSAERFLTSLVFIGITMVPAMGSTGPEPSPFATFVVDYDPGPNPVPGYTDPDAALGEPTRFTGGSFDPMVVSVLNPAWRPDEVVSIGAGGSLVLMFDEPVIDDPLNPWGIDLIIFGNALFLADGDAVENPAAIGSEGGVIELSADGILWFEVEGFEADGLFPTNGYLDVTDPFASEPGAVPADALRPVNPALTLSSFDGLSIDAVQDVYAGSAGGTGIDLASVGLSSARYVRISNHSDSLVTPEIDAVSDVQPRLPGDVDADGAVDVNDLLELLQHWGPSQPLGWNADFNADGVVDVEDLLTLLAAWS